MARRFLIVAYDVPDDKRRNRLYNLLLNWGDRVQYSVFCCQVNERERILLCRNMREIMNLNEDHAMLIDAGPVEGQKPEPIIDYLGPPYVPAPRVQIV